MFYLFFFQAEDGIRDLVRSRGLGDVYKRQPAARAHARIDRRASQGIDQGRAPYGRGSQDCRAPVSYTHLTLPTSDLV